MELGPDGSMTVVKDTSVAVRLSEGLVLGGPLDPDAVDRGLQALRRLIVEFDMASHPLRAVATAALRMTADPSPFLEPAQQLLGVRIEIIDGLEEALMVSRGAVHGLDAGGAPWVVVDIGGRSTELCWQDAKGGWNPVSIRMGVVGLTDEFINSDPPTVKELTALRGEVRRRLDELLPRALPGRLVGVAGTASTLGRLEVGAPGWNRDLVHGCTVSRASLIAWLDKTVSMTVEEREARLGLGPSRADVFPAGLCILDEVMVHLDRGDLVVSANGLRIGAALSILEET